MFGLNPAPAAIDRYAPPMPTSTAVMISAW